MDSYHNLMEQGLEPVLDALTEVFDIQREDLFGRRHLREHADARHLLMYILRKDGEMKLTDIGWFFDRDHSTVLHGIHKIEGALTYDNPLRSACLRVAASILERHRLCQI